MTDWLLRAMDWTVTMRLAWFLLHATWLPFRPSRGLVIPLLNYFRDRPRAAYVVAFAGMFLALLAPIAWSIVTTPSLDATQAFAGAAALAPSVQHDGVSASETTGDAAAFSSSQPTSSFYGRLRRAPGNSLASTTE